MCFFQFIQTKHKQIRLCDVYVRTILLFPQQFCLFIRLAGRTIWFCTNNSAHTAEREILTRCSKGKSFIQQPRFKSLKTKSFAKYIYASSLGAFEAHFYCKLINLLDYAMTICPRPICLRKRKTSYFPSHARGSPWTMRPLDDASLELCVPG